jgi:CRISPR-associated protein Cmr2
MSDSERLATAVEAPQLAALQAVLASASGAAAQAHALAAYLHQTPPAQLRNPHAPAERGREHALLAAAVAYCLGWELRARGASVEPDVLRLAALAHDLGLPAELRALLPAPVPRWVANRNLFFDALPGSPFPVNHFHSPAEQALYAAHLIAAERLPVPYNRRADLAFADHPLHRAGALPALTLLFSAVPDAAEYVFEAPLLPELRGARALLDRLARVDLPALFGARFEQPALAERAAAVREWFAARTGGLRLEAPECVLTAGPDGVLVLAPPSLAEVLQAAIEALYAEATRGARTLVVARPLTLLELQHGRHPTRFWWQEYLAAHSDEVSQRLLGDKAPPREPLTPLELPPGKGFGEIVRELRLLHQRRRDERAVYPPADGWPLVMRCPACDRAPATLAAEPADAPRCAVCARKRAIGLRATPAEQRADPALAGGLAEQFVAFLHDDAPRSPYARALRQVGEHAVGLPTALAALAVGGHIGLVHATLDGLPERLARLETPSEYAAFCATLRDHLQRALFEALASHLRPRRWDAGWVHPWAALQLDADGVWLLLPGAVALAAAATFARAFAQRYTLGSPPGDPWVGQRYRPSGAARRGDEPIPPPIQADLSLTAGVVLAPPAVPLAVLRELAAELRQNAQAARRRARLLALRRNSDGASEGYCDFLVARAASLPAERLALWRAGQTRGQDRTDLRLGAAPYTWPELQGLLTTARALREAGCPRHWLAAVAARMPDSPLTASVDYLYARLRLRDDLQRVLAAHLEAAWQGPRARDPAVAPPWRWLPPREGREQRESVVPDLLDIWDLCASQLPAEGDDAAG